MGSHAHRPTPASAGVVGAPVHGERRRARGIRALGDRRGGFARAATNARGARDRFGGRHLARRVGVGSGCPGSTGDARRRRRLPELRDRAVVFLLALGSFDTGASRCCRARERVRVRPGRREDPDDFFLVWPSYWNVVALYVWLLELSPAAASAWRAVLRLIFVPLSTSTRASSGACAARRRSRPPRVIAMRSAPRRPRARARARSLALRVYPAYYVALPPGSASGGGKFSRSEPKASEDHLNGSGSDRSARRALDHLGTPDAAAARGAPHFASSCATRA